VGEKVSAALGR